MAEMIKRHYDLTTLKVTLLADEHPATVRCELQVTENHRPETLQTWKVGAKELGLPSTLDADKSRGQGYRFTLPDPLLQELAERLHGELDPQRPLWLHLTKPYGHLGLVPWEQLLVPPLSVPVLRLPDFVVEPVRSRHALDILLCADDPGAEPAAVAAQVVSVADTIIGAALLPSTLHVFVSAPVHALLLAEYRPDRVGNGQVLIYDPAGAPTEDDLSSEADPDGTAEASAAGLPNAWLRWMRNEVCGRSIDVTHFLAHGNLGLGQGGLTLTASPGDPDNPGLTVVPTAALTRFTMQVGAWCYVFSSPPGNLSEMGLRLTADTVAQLRPGSVLHHELRLDSGGVALADGYRFLTATDPTWPPASPATFLYCQPFQVITEPRKDELLAGAPQVEPITTPKVRRLLAEEPATPTWVAASQRFVEQYEWRLHHWRDQGSAGPTLELSAGVEKALGLIQGVVEKHADSPANLPDELHKSQVTDVASAPPPSTANRVIRPPEAGR